MDLLCRGSRPPGGLRVREEQHRGFYVEGLRTVPCDSAAQVAETPSFFLLYFAKKKQQQKYQRVIFRSAVGGAADGAGHQNQNHRGHAREHKQQPLTHAHCATAQTGDVHSQITE